MPLRISYHRYIARHRSRSRSIVPSFPPSSTIAVRRVGVAVYHLLFGSILICFPLWQDVAVAYTNGFMIRCWLPLPQ